MLSRKNTRSKLFDIHVSERGGGRREGGAKGREGGREGDGGGGREEGGEEGGAMILSSNWSKTVYK